MLKHISEKTIAAYNKYAKAYDDEVIEFWKEFPMEFITEFVSKLPNKLILDLGSGSGRDALLLRDAGAEVVCVDASEQMTNITKNLGFSSTCATFSDFNYEAEKFGGVWAYTSLIHIPKSEAKGIIKKIHTALATGGLFAIGVIEGETDGMVERETMPGSSRYFKYYERDELRQLVESCGFSLLHEQDYKPRTHTYINQIYKKSP